MTTAERKKELEIEYSKKYWALPPAIIRQLVNDQLEQEGL